MLVTVILGLLISGCRPAQAADGYTFEREQFVQTTFVTEVVLVGSDKEMRSLFYEHAARGQRPPVILKAFSVIGEGRCRLFIRDPRRRYQPELVGHELLHCLFGDWHPQRTKDNR